MTVNQITLTNLNVRQSITILIVKIMLVDILMAALVITAYFLIVAGSEYVSNYSLNTLLFLSVFVALGIIKFAINAYIILLWLYEYYEITTEYVIHKKGFIFKKAEKYKLANVRAINVEDSFLGQIFNYATITLFDIRLNKYLDMYLIHNPRRYEKVLKQIRPDLETKTDNVNLPLIPKGERIEESDE